jgi:hypothetical protein
LAQRVIRVARDLDPELTHRAAAIALEDSSLDDATRENLEMLVDEVRAKAPPPRKPAEAPASAPKAVEQTRPALDSDIDLGHTSELTDPVEFARLNLQSVAVGSQLEPDLDGIDPNALSVSSLEKEFSGDLGLEEGDELTDPDAREWNDPSLVENLDQTSDQSDALFDKGGLDGAPDDESVATASAQSVPAEDEPAVDTEGAALAPLDTRSKVGSDTSVVARLGKGSGEGAEPSRSEELPAEALPGLGASPGLEDLARFEPSQDEMDSLAAPAPAPATAKTAPTPPTLLTPTAPPTPPAAPSTGSAVVVPPPSVGRDRTEVVDIAADGGLRRLKVVQGVPVGVKSDALEIEVEGRGSSSVPFARIDAVAVAAVAGLSAKPVLVIDLVLNWLDASETSLKVIRLQSNRFDPVRLVGSASSPLEALQRLVEGVLKRSGGTPLPDAAAASGTPYTSYPDIAAYQRQVLCAEE